MKPKTYLSGDINDDSLMRDAQESVAFAAGQVIRTREHVYDVFEGPLGPVGEVLWEKNIPTRMSNGHVLEYSEQEQKRIPGKSGYVYIWISYDSLSSENKRIVQSYLQGKTDTDMIAEITPHVSGARKLSFTLAVEANDKMGTVKEAFMRIADMFAFQESLTSVASYTLHDLLDTHGYYCDQKEDGYIEGKHGYTHAKVWVARNHLKLDHWKEKGYLYSKRVDRFFKNQKDLNAYHAILDDRALEI